MLLMCSEAEPILHDKSTSLEVRKPEACCNRVLPLEFLASISLPFTSILHVPGRLNIPYRPSHLFEPSRSMAVDTSRQTLLSQDSQPNNPDSVRDTLSHDERRHTKWVAFHSHNWLRFRKQTTSKGIRASEKTSDLTTALKLRYHRLKL